MKKVSDRNFKNLERVLEEIQMGLDKGADIPSHMSASLYLAAWAVIDDGRAK